MAVRWRYRRCSLLNRTIAPAFVFITNSIFVGIRQYQPDNSTF